MRYYAHPSTTVLRLTTWPRGHPQEYSVEEDAYVAEYIERGWCFAETCWAALTTNFERSLDLGKFTGTKTRLHGTKGVLAEKPTAGARRKNENKCIGRLPDYVFVVLPSMSLAALATWLLSAGFTYVSAWKGWGHLVSPYIRWWSPRLHLVFSD